MTKSERAAWIRALKRASALRTTQHHVDYSDLCYALKGNEGQACFQALIDSVRARQDHGAYEATYKPTWRFAPKDFAAFMAKALPGFIQRMARTGQVERLLIGVEADRKVTPLLVARLKELPRPEREKVLRAFKRWARHEAAWEEFLQKHFDVAPKPVGRLTVPPEWPARYRLAVERHLEGELELREHWERWPRKDMALFVAHLVAVDDLGPLWKEVGVLLTPLATYAGKQQDVFNDHIGGLSPARRARALTNLRRINTGPNGGMFHGMVWPEVKKRLRIR